MLVSANGMYASLFALINPYFTGSLLTPLMITCLVIWMQDYCQTFFMEIHAIWSRKLTGSSMLFIVNRYMFLWYIIAQSAMDLPGTTGDRQCVSYAMCSVLIDTNNCGP